MQVIWNWCKWFEFDASGLNLIQVVWIWCEWFEIDVSELNLAWVILIWLMKDLNSECTYGPPYFPLSWSRLNKIVRSGNVLIPLISKRFKFKTQGEFTRFTQDPTIARSQQESLATKRGLTNRNTTKRRILQERILKKANKGIEVIILVSRANTLNWKIPFYSHTHANTFWTNTEWGGLVKVYSEKNKV